MRVTRVPAIARATPDGPVDQGDDCIGVPAHRPHELLEWIGERERVHPANGSSTMSCPADHTSVISAAARRPE
jgi:hypothetical protein